MKLTAFLILSLSSVTLSSAYAVTEASGASVATFSPSSEKAFDLQSDPGTDVYRRPIQIVFPDVGVFPGWLHDEIVQGTVKGIAGKSPSAPASEPDFLQLVN